MDDNYKTQVVGKEPVENPHKRLAGTYKSFDELRQAVESVNPNTRLTSDFHSSPHLIGSPYQGYSVAVPGMNLGRGGGQTYIQIGRIMFPLLQDGERVDIKKLN